MRRLAVLAGMLLIAAGPSVLAEAATPPFTQDQAEHGGEVYAERCASCHGPNLNDGQFGPSLKGARFALKWGGKPASELFDFLGKSMPPAQVGVLSADDYADVMAFMLAVGGAHAGDKRLPADDKALSGITLPR